VVQRSATVAGDPPRFPLSSGDAADEAPAGHVCKKLDEMRNHGARAGDRARSVVSQSQISVAVLLLICCCCWMISWIYSATLKIIELGILEFH
jgi:hypothetical protein